MAQVIELRNVSKIYPDATVAVRGVSLLVPEGKTTVMVGSSGCGKTTLLRMVNRMVTPTSGQVLVAGVDVATVKPVALRRSIGYVMQNSGLLPHRRVIDNIATVPLLNRVPKKIAHHQALELMDTVGLDRDLAQRYPSQLSGGQQQRVGVARGLAADPKVLLMDEPFGAVDPIVRAGLQRELRDLQARLHKTILFVTHDITEAFTLGDQIVILAAGGRIAQIGTPQQILTDPADDFVQDLIGLTSGDRTLHLEPGPYGDDLVLDSIGRPVGRLRRPS
mgnify:FL=1